MTEAANVEQKSMFATGVNQIATQNNYYGMTPAEALEMSLRIFRDYYPKLTEDVFSKFKAELLQKLSDIPAENIVPAPLSIAIRTLFHASITEEDEIRKLYANLLSASMNKTKKDKIHPGYCEIISQLSPDEAKIMKYIAEKDYIPVLSLFYSSNIGGTEVIIRNFSNVGELTGCDYPLEVSKYFDNLRRLGLIEISDASPSMINSLTDKELYEPLNSHTYIQSTAKKLNTRGAKDKFTENVEGYVSITDYGREFCSLCIGDLSCQEKEDSTLIERPSYVTASDVANDTEVKEMLDEVFSPK